MIPQMLAAFGEIDTNKLSVDQKWKGTDISQIYKTFSEVYLLKQPATVLSCMWSLGWIPDMPVECGGKSVPSHLQPSS